MINNEKKKVFVVGGTHGNEFTGVYLVKKLRSLGLKDNYKKITPFFELGNEEAFRLNKRYVDHDLNRCFSKDFLLDLVLSSSSSPKLYLILSDTVLGFLRLNISVDSVPVLCLLDVEKDNLLQ